MKKIFLALLFILSIVSCKTTAQTTNSNSKTQLFNGNNLNGWEIYGTEKWYVEDQLLICENGPEEGFGYLATKKKYKNFELTLEFKKGIRSNGGIFVHSEIEGTKIKGWQAEIAIPTHFTGGVHKYETGWLAKPDLEKDKVIKIGQWNTMKVLVNENQITTWVNGTQMVTITDKEISTTKGPIALQIHDGSVTKIAWRNIQIKEL